MIFNFLIDVKHGKFNVSPGRQLQSLCNEAAFRNNTQDREGSSIKGQSNLLSINSMPTQIGTVCLSTAAKTKSGALHIQWNAELFQRVQENGDLSTVLKIQAYKVSIRICTGIYTKITGNEIRSPVSHSHSLSFHVNVGTFGFYGTKYHHKELLVSFRINLANSFNDSTMRTN
jgi:hypothetical protein